MSTPHKANRNTAIKTTGRTLVGVGVTGAVALTGAGFGQAQPHIDNQRENSGPDTDLDALLKQLATTNQDLATLQHQLGQDQERANKALVDLQSARLRAADAQKEADAAAAQLATAQKNVLHAQQQLIAQTPKAVRHVSYLPTLFDVSFISRAFANAKRRDQCNRIPLSVILRFTNVFQVEWSV